MFNELIKTKLKLNWGEMAESMACFAEIKFIDSLSPWACYILAMNPQDEDEIKCIIDGFTTELCNWSLQELSTTYNSHGEPPKLDPEFRPMLASELFKRLKK